MNHINKKLNFIVFRQPIYNTENFTFLVASNVRNTHNTANSSSYVKNKLDVMVFTIRRIPGKAKIRISVMLGCDLMVARMTWNKYSIHTADCLSVYISIETSRVKNDVIVIVNKYCNFNFLFVYRWNIVAKESRDNTVVTTMAHQLYISSWSYGLLANELLKGSLSKQIYLQEAKKANRASRRYWFHFIIHCKFQN